MKKIIRLNEKYSLLRKAESYKNNIETTQNICLENFSNMFGDRAINVLENVTKVLGAVYGSMNANKDPANLVKGNMKPLIDVVAGVKALKDAGPGGDSMALKSYIERIKNEKRNLTPEQQEIEAIKQAGRHSKTNAEIQQTFAEFNQAISAGDMEKANKLKAEFGKLFQFYQNLVARTQGKPKQNR